MSNLVLKRASRKRVKIKIGLTGPSGSGKTTSALKMAYGLCGDWEKICVLDTENESSQLYANKDGIGEFLTIPIAPPFAPEIFIEAIHMAVKEGVEVVIVDSLSHEWSGPGGCLDILSNLTGNQYTNWKFITPRHDALVTEILQCPIHVIATIRSKQEYAQSEKGGKKVVEKLGLGPVQRDGLDYEFTTVLKIGEDHRAEADKDRTGLFVGKDRWMISEADGEAIINWCNEGPEIDPIAEALVRIRKATSLSELKSAYDAAGKHAGHEDIKAALSTRKQEIIAEQSSQ